MREKEYLSIFLFILLIAFLILGGNYLIKLKPASTNNTSSTTKIDATKEYVYFSNEEVVSLALDITFKDIHINLKSEAAQKLAEKLNNQMASAKASYVKLSSVNVDKSKIIYDLDEDNIYETDFVKYDVKESKNYLTIEVSTGHINVTREESTSYLNYYVFDKNSGELLSNNDIKRSAKISDKNIAKIENDYLEAKENSQIIDYQLFYDKYENIYVNLLVKSDDITYNDVVKVN